MTDLYLAGYVSNRGVIRENRVDFYTRWFENGRFQQLVDILHEYELAAFPVGLNVYFVLHALVMCKTLFFPRKRTYSSHF